MAGGTPSTPPPVPTPASETPRHLPGYVTLQSIVYDVLNEMKEYSFAEYKRLMQFAIRGFIHLNLYDLTSFRVAYLEVNSAGIVEFPDDLVDWIKIGEIDSTGKIRHWLPNKDLYIDRSIVDGERVNPYYNAQTEGIDSDSLIGCIFAPHFFDGNYLTRLYGMRGGYAPGYFRIDEEERVIRCDRTPPGSKLVLEYNSTGVSIDGATWIPRHAVEAMIAWVHWKRKKELKEFTRGDRADAKQDFLEEEESLRAYENAPSIQELEDIIYESYTQSIKR